MMKTSVRVRGWVWLCVLALAAGCKTEPKPGEGAGQATGHEHPMPGIDCPLRKAGVDPSQLRPFAEVEKYIAFLDRLERDAWQKPDDVVRALNLRGTETVYDLGAGSGYFSFRFARAVPRGKVVAADLEPEMIRHINHKGVMEGLTNLNLVLIKGDEPQVPREADWVFVCDVLHHVSDRSGWLKKVAGEMKSDARLVLIEFKEGTLPEGPPESAKIPRKQLIELLTEAGLQFEYEKPELLPYQVFLVFRKEPVPAAVLETARGETGVIAYYFHGRDQGWRLLGQTWDRIQIPPHLDRYIVEETTQFLAQ
jgi:ubiquinone/menaquinone biosynthesis C-methylase UbiE